MHPDGARLRAGLGKALYAALAVVKALAIAALGQTRSDEAC